MPSTALREVSLLQMLSESNHIVKRVGWAGMARARARARAPALPFLSGARSIAQTPPTPQRLPPSPG